MIQNLALLSQEEKDKIKVDLAAAGVAFKERYNISVCSKTVEDEQPPLLRQWFRQRLIYYRKISINLSSLAYIPNN